MRVTSNLFPETFKSQLYDLQERQLQFQKEIATGLKLYRSSQDPVHFQFAQQTTEARQQNNAYLNTNSEALTHSDYNHQSIKDLMTSANRAYELGMRATNIYSADQLKAIGVEMSNLLNQLASTVNNTMNGDYLFGGTANQQPVTITAGDPPTYNYNPSTNSNISQAQVSRVAFIDTSFVSGRPAAAGAPGYTGLLVSNPAASMDPNNPDVDSDIFTAVTALRNSLDNGIPIEQDGNAMKAVKLGMERLTENLGRSAARMEGLELNKSSLRDQVQIQSERIGDLTEASLTDSIANLQKIQLHYQGALQSGARVLSISLMDYIR